MSAVRPASKRPQAGTLAAVLASAFFMVACSTLTTRVVNRADDDVPQAADRSGVSTAVTDASNVSGNAARPDDARYMPLIVTDYRTTSRESGSHGSARKASLRHTTVEANPEPVAAPVAESVEIASDIPDVGATSGTIMAAIVPGGEAIAADDTSAHGRLVAVESSAPGRLSNPFDVFVGATTRWRGVFNDFVALHSEGIWSACAIALALLAWAYTRRRRKRKWWFHGHR
ncbi:MAG TPA: hypothetical protein VLN59_14600 [Burkholderiales bacterium]|nr:hypothetical protein [Burkholderiales bacterium]